eukprot:799167-Rhodomonas_salina.1
MVSSRARGEADGRGMLWLEPHSTCPALSHHARLLSRPLRAGTCGWEGGSVLASRSGSSWARSDRTGATTESERQRRSVCST